MFDQVAAEGFLNVFAGWEANGNSLGNDPDRAAVVPIGPYSVSILDGGLRIEHPLDFDLSPGTSVGRNPALVYNSSTVSARPDIEVSVRGEFPHALQRAQVRLSFDGRPEEIFDFRLPAQPPKDGYTFTVRPSDPVTKTGIYKWKATVVLKANPADNKPPISQELT